MHLLTKSFTACTAVWFCTGPLHNEFHSSIVLTEISSLELARIWEKCKCNTYFWNISKKMSTFEESAGLPTGNSTSCSSSGKFWRQHIEYSNKCFLRKECISAMRRTNPVSKTELRCPSLAENDPGPESGAALKRDFYYIISCHLKVKFLQLLNINTFWKYSKICKMIQYQINAFPTIKLMVLKYYKFMLLVLQFFIDDLVMKQALSRHY